MTSTSSPGATDRLISLSTDVRPNDLATPVSLTTGWTMAWPLVAPLFLFAVFLAGAAFTTAPFGACPFVAGRLSPFPAAPPSPAPLPPRPGGPPRRGPLFRRAPHPL